MGYFYYPVIFDYPDVISKPCVQHDRIIEEALYIKKFKKKRRIQKNRIRLIMDFSWQNHLFCHRVRRPKIGLSKTTLLKISLIVDEDPRVVVNTVPSLPKAGEQRMYCRRCLNDISGDEYNSKRRKLPRNKSQCQKCGEL